MDPGAARIRTRNLPLPRPALPTALADQLDVPDRDPTIQRLAHVVDGEARCADGYQSLHLDTGSGGGPDPRDDVDAGCLLVGLEEAETGAREAVERR